MRFGKFFFALLFGVVFLITLMKVLVFGLFAAMIFGGIFLLRRAFGHRRQQYHPAWAQTYEAEEPMVGFGNPHQDFEQAINPSWRKQKQAAAYGRRIEVL